MGLPKYRDLVLALGGIRATKLALQGPYEQKYPSHDAKKKLLYVMSSTSLHQIHR
jgi:hypothetical protein